MVKLFRFSSRGDCLKGKKSTSPLHISIHIIFFSFNYYTIWIKFDTKSPRLVRFSVRLVKIDICQSFIRLSNKIIEYLKVVISVSFIAMGIRLNLVTRVFASKCVFVKYMKLEYKMSFIVFWNFQV